MTEDCIAKNNVMMKLMMKLMVYARMAAWAVEQNKRKEEIGRASCRERVSPYV